MSASCGVCGLICSDESCIKCGGVCGGSFHVKCVKAEGVKTRTGNKVWKCEDCARKKESSVESSKSTTPATAVTKEFLIGVLEEFKKEVFKEFKQQSDRMKEFTTSLEFLYKSVDEANTLAAATRKDYAELKKQNEDLRVRNDELTGRVDHLSERVRELEQYSRRNNIEVSGVPATAKENIIALVKDIGAAIGQQVDESQISAAHRVPSFNSKRDPALVIQFQSRMERDKWISGFKAKKTLHAIEVNPTFNNNRVYINEHLSPENKQFLSKLKVKCKEIGFKYVWVREGKFFVRKSDGEKCHKVVNMQELNKLS